MLISIRLISATHSASKKGNLRVLVLFLYLNENHNYIKQFKNVSLVQYEIVLGAIVNI